MNETIVNMSGVIQKSTSSAVGISKEKKQAHSIVFIVIFIKMWKKCTLDLLNQDLTLTLLCIECKHITYNCNYNQCLISCNGGWHDCGVRSGNFGLSFSAKRIEPPKIATKLFFQSWRLGFPNFRHVMNAI